MNRLIKSTFVTITSIQNRKLRGLGFNLINIEDSRICKDTNHIKAIKQLRKDTVDPRFYEYGF